MVSLAFQVVSGGLPSFRGVSGNLKELYGVSKAFKKFSRGSQKVLREL